MYICIYRYIYIYTDIYIYIYYSLYVCIHTHAESAYRYIHRHKPMYLDVNWISNKYPT